MNSTIRVTLDSWSYDKSAGKLVFGWRLDQNGDPRQLLLSDHCSISFDPVPVSFIESDVVDVFIGIVCTHLASKTDVLEVCIRLEVEAGQTSFWIEYLRGLVPSCRTSISAPACHTRGGMMTRLFLKRRAKRLQTGRLGLYFGGGVESLNLLSLLRHQCPMLLTVDGPRWMNSDYERSAIKVELQRKLAREQNCEFLRVWTDARLLFPDDDLHVNRYVTGTLMYYSLLPLLRSHGVTACLFGAEMEYAQVDDAYDQSIHPRYIHRVVRPPNPPVLPALTAIPKVRLLADLYERAPEFLEYLYSCFHNTSRRWCGDCGKCRRISRFCDVIGIPKHLIGMQEGIPPEREDGDLSRIYWENCEKFSREKVIASGGKSSSASQLDESAR